MIDKLKRGDIVWLDFNSTKTSELKPALVISPEKYNSISGMVLVCPITNNSVEYFFEVEINSIDLLGKSFVMVDQIRSCNILKQVKKKTGKVTEKELDEVLAKIEVLLRKN